ncbi:MAG: FAD:protein FMN transferase [bacterium]|nr:FAD:protein FMN transferase [bacterium]
MRKQNCRNWIITFIIFFVLLNVSCGKYKKTEETKFIMGTIVNVKIYQTDEGKAKTVIKKAFDEMERVDRVFSNFKEDSFISKINRNSGTWVEVPEEVVELIERSLKYSALTDGAFDISIAPIVDLWGFGPAKKHYIPTEKEISDTLPLVNYKNIEIDKEKNRIKIKTGMRLEPGGIAKIYALERAVKVIKESGIKTALVNAGGDIYALGEKQKGEPFKIGIQHPRNDEEILVNLKVSDAAIITSGDYENYFIENDKRYHHIFDPKTGHSGNLCQSVTIVSKDMSIPSTGIFVLGPEKGIKLVESIPGAECLIVDSSGKIFKSKGFDKYIAK